MCGIVGYVNLNKKPIRDTGSILKMLKVQKHRGPDDSGVRAFSLFSGRSLQLSASDPKVIEGNFEGVLGFNRLSILDLSVNGHQPMISPDNNVILALNGEIYNAFDYRQDLEDWGYRFKSSTDTEIVLALYLRHGMEGLLKLLNGMFAIIVVDLKRNELIIARDRFGIKPMYYINTGSTLAFSSELKSFRYLDGFSFNLEEEQLDEYLIFRNNLKGTLFKGIESLDPGSTLTYRHGSDPILSTYFDVNKYSRSNRINGGFEEYSEKLQGWLSESVTRQLMSDVKLGCQLSGGIDSSLVTWFANKNSEKGKFEAVSIIFNNIAFNEEKYIDKVSETLGITSHKFLLDSDYYYNNFESATWHLEAPLNHPNTVAIYKLSQKAKECVTVLLSGEGADEVFGGYRRFYDLRFPFHPEILLHKIKKDLFHPSELFGYLSSQNRAILATAFMSPRQATMLKPDFSKSRSMQARLTLYQTLSGSLFDRQVKYEMLSYLPDLLIRQDKMSMAHSIENRVPFLDNMVVENAFSIPEELLLIRKSTEGFNNEKLLLKLITAKIFGKEFGFRDKMGFGVPIREFFLNANFSEYLNDKILKGIQARGLFNQKLVSGWVHNIPKLKYFELEALWVIIAFEVWASLYLDGDYEARNSPS